MEVYKIGKEKIQMPSGWHEVPFWKGQVIFEKPVGELECLSLISGKSIDQINNMLSSVDVFYFLTSFTFIQELPEVLKTPQMPRSVKINGDYVIFPFVIHNDPFDLGQCSVGQIKDMEMIISNHLESIKQEQGITEENQDELSVKEIDTIKMCPYLCAIYIQKIIDKEYDYSRAMKLVDVVSKQLSFKEVTSMGYFFFKRLIDWRNGSLTNFQKRRPIRTKFRRAYWKFIRFLVSIRHWT